MSRKQASNAALSLGAGQQEGVGDDTEVLFVGCLPVEIEISEQEVRMLLLVQVTLAEFARISLLVQSPICTNKPCSSPAHDELLPLIYTHWTCGADGSIGAFHRVQMLRSISGSGSEGAVLQRCARCLFVAMSMQASQRASFAWKLWANAVI